MHFDVWMQLKSCTFLFSDQFTNTFFLKSAMGYFLVQWSLQWEREYPQKKSRTNLSKKLLGDVWIHLTELHLCFLEQSIKTVFEEPEKGTLDRIEAYAGKGNIIRS